MVGLELEKPLKTKGFDNLDRRILYELDLNGRQTLAKIGKRIGKIPEVILYRYKRMKKRGLYIQDVVIIDPSKLGYIAYILYLQIGKISRTQEIIDYMKEVPQIWGIDKLVGKYQLYTFVYVRSASEFAKIIQELRVTFSDTIINYRVLMLYNGVSTAHNYLFPKGKLIKHHKIRFDAEKIELSDKEMQILHCLTEDGRMSYTAIAKRVNSTAEVVRKRFLGLVKKEVILYIRPSLNSCKLNYLHKHIIIKLRFQKMKDILKVKEYLVNQRATKALYLTIGRYDITGRFIFSNLEEFNQFKEGFYEHFGNDVHSFISDDYYEDIDYSPHKSIGMLLRGE